MVLFLGPLGLNALFPTGNINITYQYSAKKGKLRFSMLRSIKVTGLCPHYIYISTKVHSSCWASVCTGHAGGPWGYVANSAFLISPICDFILGDNVEGTTLYAPEIYLRNSRYGCKEYYKVSSCTLKHQCTCHIRRLRVGKFLQGILADCCIPMQLQWFGFSQQWVNMLPAQ